MDWKSLRDIPPWDWPEGTGAQLLRVIQDAGAAEEDRLLAADLAGDFTVIDDGIAAALLALLRRPSESAALRGQAAISLGPALEYAETEGFEDPEEVPISERTFRTAQETLLSLYRDAGVPKEVRRRVLEASVRAPRQWHADAVRASYMSGDPEWELTAVFCMRFIPGFDEQIVEALRSDDPFVRCEAVHAAGAWGVEAAWPHLARILREGAPDKALLLAAVDAVVGVRPEEAEDLLAPLLDSPDEDVAEAAYEAVAMAEALLGGGGEELEDEEEEDEEDDEGGGGGFLH
jgi:hypothetical protein